MKLENINKSDKPITVEVPDMLIYVQQEGFMMKPSVIIGEGRNNWLVKPKKKEFCNYYNRMIVEKLNYRTAWFTGEIPSTDEDIPDPNRVRTTTQGYILSIKTNHNDSKYLTLSSPNLPFFDNITIVILSPERVYDLIIELSNGKTPAEAYKSAMKF